MKPPSDVKAAASSVLHSLLHTDLPSSLAHFDVINPLLKDGLIELCRPRRGPYPHLHLTEAGRQLMTQPAPQPTRPAQTRPAPQPVPQQPAPRQFVKHDVERDLGKSPRHLPADDVARLNAICRRLVQYTDGVMTEDEPVAADEPVAVDEPVASDIADDTEELAELAVAALASIDAKLSKAHCLELRNMTKGPQSTSGKNRVRLQSDLVKMQFARFTHFTQADGVPSVLIANRCAITKAGRVALEKSGR